MSFLSEAVEGGGEGERGGKTIRNGTTLGWKED